LFRSARLLDRFRGERLSSLAWLSLAFVAVIGIAWASTRNLIPQTAFSAFSPVGMIHPVSAFPDFAEDFPGGEGEMMRSLIGRIYRFLGEIGIPDHPASLLMTMLEATTLMLGSFALARRLNPHLPRWTAIGAALLVAAGSIASADLARWFHPYYGSVYGFAHGFAFAAMAAVLARRGITAGSLIGLSACAHPIIALFSGAAMGAMILVDLRSHRPAELAGAAAAALAIVGLWYAIAFREAGISGGDVDGSLYLAVTRVMSFHWYPLDLDVFGARAWETLLPLTALILVTLSVIAAGPDETRGTDRLVLAAMAALAVISLAGVLSSAISSSPFLIKLAPHRASLNLLLLATVIAVPRLLDLAVRGDPLTAIFSAALVLLPFWRDHGLPIPAALGFSLLILIGRAGRVERNGRLILFPAAGAAVLVCLALIAGGYCSAIVFDAMSAVGAVGHASFLWILAGMAVARVFRLPVLAALSVAVGVWLWLPRLDPMASSAARENAESYLEVQRWARGNTPPGTLFILDPTQSYGWRQYSERPSFGVMREWLYAGWIYNTDPKWMGEGLRRAGLLGLTPKDFTPARNQTVEDVRVVVRDKLKASYNSMTAVALARFAGENGISYFVFNRANRPDLSDLDVVFENRFYAVVRPQSPVS